MKFGWNHTFYTPNKEEAYWNDNGWRKSTEGLIVSTEIQQGLKLFTVFVLIDTFMGTGKEKRDDI